MSTSTPKKIEGGQGGKRGHSNMCHYEGTEIIKYKTRRQRRIDAKRQIREQLKED